MTTTQNRDDIIKQYELMNIEDGVYKSQPVEKLSTEFMKARIDFANWYDNKPEEMQELIDEIANRTSFIIDEDAYDEFIELLSEYDITTVEQFEDAFEGEWEGYGEQIYAMFAEEYCGNCGYDSDIPDIFKNAIDWEQVYYQTVQYDFYDFDFRGNRYFFRREP